MKPSNIQSRIEQRVMRVTIDRPDSLNALNSQTLKELHVASIVECPIIKHFHSFSHSVWSGLNQHASVVLPLFSECFLPALKIHLNMF